MTRPPPTIPVARDLGDVNNILRDIGLYLKQLSLLPGVVVPATTMFRTRLGSDNAAIPAGAAPVAVANLEQAVVVGEQWDLEWLLDIALSSATDVLRFNVSADAGTFTGRYTVTGINGVPGTWDGLVNILEADCGTATPASTHAPGNVGSVGDVTTVLVRARGVHSVANGNVRVLVVATDTSGAASGTATVKARSQLVSQNVT